MRVRLKIAIVIMFVVTTFSCSKQSTEPIYHPYEPSNNAMVFDAYNFEEEVTEPNTKGKIKNQFEEGDSFGVLGYYLSDGEWNSTATPATTNETPNFMYNQQVTMSNSVWSYSPIKYWPADVNQKVRFFAYYPHNNNNIETSGIELSGNSATGYPTIKFTPKSDVSQQVDFMTAQTGLLNGGNIPLSFEHQLTKISFGAKYVGDQGTKVFIHEISNIKGIKTSTGGVFSSGEFTWSGEYSMDIPTYGISTSRGEIIDGEGAFLSSSVAKPVTTSKGCLLVHPQQIASSDMSFDVSYITQKNNENSIYVVQRVTVLSAHEYVKGKQLQYTFTIDINSIKEITIGKDQISITPWTTHIRPGDDIVIE